MQASDSPHDYYRMREAQELEMAAKAEDPAVQLIHLTLAAKYRQLLSSGDVSVARVHRPDATQREPFE